MLRATLTVTLKDGTNYDANHLAITKGKGGESMLSFESSGESMLVPWGNVVNVQMSASEHACWCPWCDGRIDGIGHSPVGIRERQREMNIKTEIEPAPYSVKGKDA